MTKIIFFALILITTSAVKAQTVNDIPLKDIDVEYVQIVGTSRLLSNKLTIEIDFGQENKLFSSDKDTRIKDVNGKNMIFNSMIDALNFMTKNAYEFVQAYAFSVGNQNVYHYLLRRKKL
jgi:hypothetical protein